jgi:hypothetical protein
MVVVDALHHVLVRGIERWELSKIIAAGLNGMEARPFAGLEICLNVHIYLKLRPNVRLFDLNHAAHSRKPFFLSRHVTKRSSAVYTRLCDVYATGNQANNPYGKELFEQDFLMVFSALLEPCLKHQ